MPIVTIQSTVEINAKTVESMIREVQAAGAQALNCEKSNVWVRFEPISSKYYVQEADPRQNSTIVLIKAQEGRTEPVKELFVRALVGVIAKELRIDAWKIWVHYGELKARDIWSGNQRSSG